MSFRVSINQDGPTEPLLSSKKAQPSPPPSTNIPTSLVETRFWTNRMEIKSSEFFLFRAIKYLHALCWYIPYNVPQPDGSTRTVWVKTEDLCKDLHLDKDHIKTALKNRHLERLVGVTLHNSRVVNSCFQRFTTQYATKKPEDVLYSEQRGKEEHQLHFSTVQAVTREIDKWRSDPFIQYDLRRFGKVFVIKEEENKHGAESTAFLAKIENGQLQIYHYRNKPVDMLGEGSSGRAFKLYNVTSRCFEVLKTPVRSSAAASIRHEYRMLRQVKDKDTHHLQQVSAFIDIPGAYPLLGVITPFYEGTLDSLIRKGRKGKPMSIEDALSCGDQLIIARLELAAKGVWHGDIKPENILYRVIKRDEEEFYEFQLADFGGSQLLAKPATPFEFHITPEYTSTAHRDALIAMRKKIPTEPLSTIGPAQDTFALGALFTRLFSEASPFTLEGGAQWSDGGAQRRGPPRSIDSEEPFKREVFEKGWHDHLVEIPERDKMIDLIKRMATSTLEKQVTLAELQKLRTHLFTPISPPQSH